MPSSEGIDFLNYIAFVSASVIAIRYFKLDVEIFRLR